MYRFFLSLVSLVFLVMMTALGFFIIQAFLHLPSQSSMIAQASAETHKPSDPLAHTYSIVARDPETGEMGVAVQSHWFSVGSVVSWGEGGVDNGLLKVNEKQLDEILARGR